ncbi:MAG: aldo/keto reductase [Pirellulales bacterium]
METRLLGSTGIRISVLAFGAGPVPSLMTSDDGDRQRAAVRRALDVGINWFDTAATYGDGQSEIVLGRALRGLGALGAVHIATKVRLVPEDLDMIEASVRRSVAGSLDRLGVARLTLLQLHNAITGNRGDQPTSVTPDDVLGPGGILDAFRKLRDEGIVGHIGLTGIGHPSALRAVLDSGQFATMQVPYNVLNPSAGESIARPDSEQNYGNIMADCAARGMGVLAIRVFAGGALTGQPPSRHTLRTKFFPLALYHRHQQRCERLRAHVDARTDLKEVALRFVLSHPDVSAAIVGFGEPAHIDEALAFVQNGRLPSPVMADLRAWRVQDAVR